MGSSTSKNDDEQMLEENNNFLSEADTMSTCLKSKDNTEIIPPEMCKIGDTNIEVGTPCTFRFQVINETWCEDHLAFALKENCLLTIDGSDRVIEHQLTDEYGRINCKQKWFPKNPNRFERIKNNYKQQKDSQDPSKLFSYVMKDRQCNCKFTA